jgi:hypothetical protein
MKGKKVVLALRQGTEIGSSKVRYVVSEITNSVEWSIGQALTKEEVDKIIDRRQFPVEVRIKG